MRNAIEMRNLLVSKREAMAASQWERLLVALRAAAELGYFSCTFPEKLHNDTLNKIKGAGLHSSDYNASSVSWYETPTVGSQLLVDLQVLSCHAVETGEISGELLSEIDAAVTAANDLLEDKTRFHLKLYQKEAWKQVRGYLRHMEYSVGDDLGDGEVDVSW